MSLPMRRGQRRVRSWGLTRNLERRGSGVRVAGVAEWIRQEASIGVLLLWISTSTERRRPRNGEVARV